MKHVNGVLGAVGLALLLLVATRVGWSGVIRQLEVVREGLIILIVLSFARLALQTTAWSIALRAQGIPTHIFELVGVRLAAQSIGYLSVFGPAISEPMRFRLLLKYRRPGAIATLADASAYGLSACLFGIVCSICSALAMVHSRGTMPLYVLSAGLLAGSFLIVRSNSLLAPLVRRLGSRSPRWLRAGHDLEVGVRGLWGQYPSAIQGMFWLDLGCQILFAGDIIAIFWCLGIPLHGETILALEAASRAARMVAGWVPARLGVDEAGAAAAFAIFGLPSASGIVLALSRRLRDLLACALGIAWLLWRERSQGGLEPGVAERQTDSGAKILSVASAKTTL